MPMFSFELMRYENLTKPMDVAELSRILL